MQKLYYSTIFTLRETGAALASAVVELATGVL